MFFLNQGLPEIREQYINAADSKSNADKFYNLVIKNKEDNVVYLAYKGAATALKSKFSTNKSEKKEMFIAGVTMVEKAIKNDPNNIEIRLIRLSIQENTPKILKYKSNITEDKNIIISTFDRQSKDLKVYIKLYVKQSKVFTEEEKKTINS
ncbi:MAG: hypothetical protein ACJAYP_001424 [Flavobacterium sp.]|jgi:hypothetical protein